MATTRTGLLVLLVICAQGLCYSPPPQGFQYGTQELSSYHPLESLPPNFIAAHHESPVAYLSPNSNGAPIQRLHGSYLPVAIHTQYPASWTSQPLIASHYMSYPSYSSGSAKNGRYVAGHVAPLFHTYAVHEPSIPLTASHPTPQMHSKNHLSCENALPSTHLLHLNHIPPNASYQVSQPFSNTISPSQVSSSNKLSHSSSSFELPNFFSILDQIAHPQVKASLRQPKVGANIDETDPTPGYYQNHHSQSVVARDISPESISFSTI